MPDSRSEKNDSIFYRAFGRSTNIIMAFSTIDEGVFIDVNMAFSRTTGYSRQELIGRSSVEMGIVSPEARSMIKESLLEKGRLDDFEIEFLAKDGQFRAIILVGEIVRIDGQRRLFIIGHDITDLKTARSELEKEKSLILAMFESTPDAFILKDEDSIYRKTNKTFCNYFGLSVDEVPGKTDFDFFTKDEALGFRNEDKEIMKKGETKEYDRKFVSENRLIWCQTIKTPVRDSNGAITGVLCSIRDITSKKRLEELLKSRLSLSDYSYSHSIPDLFQKVLAESERLTESKISFFHFVDEENQKVHINTWSDEASKNCTVRKFKAIYDLDQVGIWADCVRMRKPLIHNDYSSIGHKKGLPEGHIKIVRELVVPVFEGERIVAVLGVGNKPFDYNDMDVEIVNELAKMAWDILGKKTAEDKLTQSQKSLKTLIDNLPGIVFSAGIGKDLSLVVRFVSDGCLDVTGYSAEEFTSGRVSFIDIIHPDDFGEIKDIISGLFEGNKKADAEFRIIHRDRSIRWLSGRSVAVSIENGTIAIVEGFITDITETRKRDYDLRRFASAIHQIAESIIITDDRGIIKYVNPTFEKVTGYSSQEVTGKSVGILGAEESNESFVNELLQTISSASKWHGRFTTRKKDGDLFSEEGTISPVFDETGKIVEYVAVKRDITNELVLEERLSHAHKMEAIGTLAGGIAHDFNNILFPLIGFADILQQDLPEESHLQDYVSEILTASLRARELVKQILTFSRQSRQEKTIVRVQSILNEVVRFSKAALPSTISLKTAIDKKCRPVFADPTQIHQVTMNLITNALHAMEEKGGELFINLDEINIDSSRASDLSIRPGSYVRLTVSDTGCGIDPIIQDRIFDPYFTTKEEGKGTGIGLAVVHGIIKSHEGGIELKSSQGKGSSFLIYLPCVLEDRYERKIDAIPKALGGAERILVVDDEEAIARMVRQMLERLGYTVTVRTSSKEALQLFKDDPHRFDLIITDMTMPNMTGDRLSAEIKRISRDIPIIICTGFSEKIDAEKARLLGIEGFVFKPIVKNELAAQIRNILDSR